MARYHYRHLIQYDKEFDSPIVRAAYELMCAAHEGESRNKIEARWQYICHPIMAYDILRGMGVHAPEMLAAALVHDTLETPKFCADHDAMCREFVMLLMKEGMGKKDAQAVAEHVRDMTKEVTNPEIYDGAGKRLWPQGNKELTQIERVKHMRFETKLVKIADQAASLACNLTMENNGDFPMKDARSFSAKAQSLITVILRSGKNPQEDAILNRWESLCGWVLWQTQDLLAAQDVAARERIRDRFHFPQIFNPPMRIRASEIPVVADSLWLPGKADVQQDGLARVDFTGDGRICSYVLWAHDEAAPPTRQVQDSFLEKLREMVKAGDRFASASVGESIAVDSPYGPATGRIVYITPPMHAYAFAAAAREANVIAKGEDSLIKTRGTKLQEDAKRQERSTRPSARSL